MLTKSILAEWMKLRHSRMLLVLIVLPTISILIGCTNFYFNQGILQNEWYSLWTQVSLFYGEFFLPVLIAICSSYVCRLEHMNRNWNVLMTAPVTVPSIFIAKLTIVGILIIFVQIYFLLLYYCAGNMFGFSSFFPVETFGWIFRGWIASITISTIQLFLSLRIRSFAAPIGLSLCGVFLGLGMYVLKIGMFFPFSLLTIGMGVISQESLTIAENILFFFMNAFFIILFSTISIGKLKKTDVRT